jgi:hypothetical protein
MTTLRDAQAEPATLVDVLDYLQFELQSVELDPAESNFQRGYEYALRDLKTEFLEWYRANPMKYPGGCDCPDCRPQVEIGRTQVSTRARAWPFFF